MAAYSAFLGLFRGRPLHPIGDDGRMALSDHFRELRARLMRSMFVVIVAIIVALFFYHQIFDVLRVQGTAVVFGIPHLEDEFSFDWQSAYSKLPNIVVTNSAAAGERGRFVATCVDLVAQGREPLLLLGVVRRQLL